MVASFVMVQLIKVIASKASVSPSNVSVVSVIDSTGSESQNFLNQSYPNGVQIRQFDETVWYNQHITHIERWLTPDNVKLISRRLAGGG